MKNLKNQIYFNMNIKNQLMVQLLWNKISLENVFKGNNSWKNRKLEYQ